MISFSKQGHSQSSGPLHIHHPWKARSVEICLNFSESGLLSRQRGSTRAFPELILTHDDPIICLGVFLFCCVLAVLLFNFSRIFFIALTTIYNNLMISFSVNRICLRNILGGSSLSLYYQLLGEHGAQGRPSTTICSIEGEMFHPLQRVHAFLVERNSMFLLFHLPRASSYLKEKQSKRKPFLDMNLLKSL